MPAIRSPSGSLWLAKDRGKASARVASTGSLRIEERRTGSSESAACVYMASVVYLLQVVSREEGLLGGAFSDPFDTGSALHMLSTTERADFYHPTARSPVFFRICSQRGAGRLLSKICTGALPETNAPHSHLGALYIRNLPDLNDPVLPARGRSYCQEKVKKRGGGTSVIKSIRISRASK